MHRLISSEYTKVLHKLTYIHNNKNLRRKALKYGKSANDWFTPVHNMYYIQIFHTGN